MRHVKLREVSDVHDANLKQLILAGEEAEIASSQSLEERRKKKLSVQAYGIASSRHVTTMFLDHPLLLSLALFVLLTTTVEAGFRLRGPDQPQY